MKTPLRTSRPLSRLVTAVLFLIAFSVGLRQPVHAQATESVLHAFAGPPEGTGPEFGVVFDHAGNLFGTTPEGGNARCTRLGCGTVFELTPTGSGGWNYSPVYTYLGGEDGDVPRGNPVVDASGNVYASAFTGGLKNQGTILQFKPNGQGGWTPALVHTFTGPDGSYPYGLTIDGAGNLFGMTLSGGTHGYGTVFELSPNGSGGWSEQRLHSFTYTGADGGEPFYNTVTLDAAGNVFGLSSLGGNFTCSSGCGVLFVISKNASGHWVDTIIHEFAGAADGTASTGGVIVDSADNVYGVSPSGGIITGGCASTGGCGFVYKFTRGSAGNSIESVLYEFTGGADGQNPQTVAMDSAGHLFGTTPFTFFELTQSAGNWTQNTLYTFVNGSTAGYEPTGPLTLDGSGNVYGTAQQGGDLSCSYSGSTGCGVVYKIVP